MQAGCGAEAERDEVLRAPSPDGALDGVVVRPGSDATSVYGFQLFLPPARTVTVAPRPGSAAA